MTEEVFFDEHGKLRLRGDQQHRKTTSQAIASEVARERSTNSFYNIDFYNYDDLSSLRKSQGSVQKKEPSIHQDHTPQSRVTKFLLENAVTTPAVEVRSSKLVVYSEVSCMSGSYRDRLDYELDHLKYGEGCHEDGTCSMCNELFEEYERKLIPEDGWNDFSMCFSLKHLFRVDPVREIDRFDRDNPVCVSLANRAFGQRAQCVIAERPKRKKHYDVEIVVDKEVVSDVLVGGRSVKRQNPILVSTRRRDLEWCVRTYLAMTYRAKRVYRCVIDEVIMCLVLESGQDDLSGKSLYGRAAWQYLLGHDFSPGM